MRNAYSSISYLFHAIHSMQLNEVSNRNIQLLQPGHPSQLEHHRKDSIYSFHSSLFFVTNGLEVNHELIIYIDTKTKCCHLKKLTRKGT
jgi:hypothetical protein